MRSLTVAQMMMASSILYLFMQTFLRISDMKYLHHLFISHNRFPRTIVGIGVSEYPYMYKWSP